MGPPNESAGESFAGVDVPLKRSTFPVGLGVTLDDVGGWPAILGLLATGTDLEEAQAAAALADVLEGNATPAQIAAFIFGLRCKGETVQEMTGLVGAMLAASGISSSASTGWSMRGYRSGSAC